MGSTAFPFQRTNYFLTAFDNPFWTGVGTVLSIEGGDWTKIDKFPLWDDVKALKRDWETVGEDLNTVIASNWKSFSER